MKGGMISLLSKELKTNENFSIFHLIEDFSIEFQIKLLRKKDDEKFSKIKINSTIPIIKVNLKKEIFNKLRNITNCFFLKEDELEEMVQTEKTTLLKNAKKIGEIWKKGNTFNSWNKYFVVFFGNYLYFFAKNKDKVPAFQFFVKKIEILDLNENFGMEFAIQVNTILI